MKRTLTAIILLSVSFFCFSQKQIYVRGYVLDSKKNGLEHAKIGIKNSPNFTSSNSNGFYELAYDITNNDTIVCSLIGYVGYQTKLPLSDAKSLNLNIVLSADTTMLRGVDISVINRQKSTMMQIDTKPISLTPDAAGGIESLVKMQLGVNSSNELTSQYSVRGGNFDENSVYVNGIEIYRPLLVRASQQEGLSFINPDMVEKVEFSAGGFQAKYGDKMSSVLDVIYKKPKIIEGRIVAGFMGATGYFGSSSDKFSQSHGIRYKTNQYLLSDKLKLKNGKPILKGLDTKGDFSNSFFDYQTFLSYKFSPKINLEFLGNISQNNYNFVPKSRDTEFGTISMQRSFFVEFRGKEKDAFTTFFGSLALNFLPLHKVQLSLIASGFNTIEKESYDLIGIYSLSAIKNNAGTREKELLGSGSFHEHARNKLSASVFSIAHRGNAKLWKTNLEWGVSLQNEIISDKIHEYETRDSAQYVVPRDTSKVSAIYNLYSNNNMNSLRFQAYLQQSYSINFFDANWSFNIGVRANYWTFNQEALLSPRVNIAIEPKWKHNFVFRLASGLYHQSPFYKELRQTDIDKLGNGTIVLNRNIKAQRSTHFLFGTDYYFRLWSRPFKFTMEAYYKNATKVISYVQDNVKITYSGQNDAKAYSAGIDLKLFGEFVPGADSWISFSLMRSQEDLLNDSVRLFTNKGTNLGIIYPSYLPRPNEQRYSFSIFFQDYVPNYPEYKVSLKFVWADGFPFSPPKSSTFRNMYRTRPYRRVDLGVARGFVREKSKLLKRQAAIKELWLYLDFLNVFNIKNESSYYWVTDISNVQYAVPNYLTNFMINFRVAVDF